jgi:hypothetical protein
MHCRRPNDGSAHHRGQSDRPAKCRNTTVSGIDCDSECLGGRFR